ncbi:MAG: hypothetical protein FWC26_04540 [Fibromonadales bacterium]|nr:hypothetical protein [Fibromonadales bacterium]
MQWYAFLGIKPEDMPKTVPNKNTWIEMFDCALYSFSDFLRSFHNFAVTIYRYECDDCKLEFAFEWMRECKKETMAQIAELFNVYPIPTNEKIILTPDYKMRAESSLDFLNFLIKINFNPDYNYAKPKEGNKLYEVYEFWHKTVETEINRFLDYAKQTNANIEERQLIIDESKEWDEKIKSYTGGIQYPYKLFNTFCERNLDWVKIYEDYDGLVMSFPQFSCISKFNFSMEFFKYRGQEMETLLESEEFKEDMSQLPKLIELHKNISEHIRKSVKKYIKTPKFIKFRENLKKIPKIP